MQNQIDSTTSTTTLADDRDALIERLTDTAARVLSNPEGVKQPLRFYIATAMELLAGGAR